jgi:hypothetical protein
LIDDVSFLHHHFHWLIVDKSQVHHNVMLEEVIMAQVVKM